MSGRAAETRHSDGVAEACGRIRRVSDSINIVLNVRADPCERE